VGKYDVVVVCAVSYVGKYDIVVVCALSYVRIVRWIILNLEVFQPLVFVSMRLLDVREEEVMNNSLSF
jgi:hypothetical protein